MMVRGVNRQVIFRNDQDREDFVRKIAGHADAGALTVYAWALLSNHLHLLVRTGTRPLADVGTKRATSNPYFEPGPNDRCTSR